MIAWCAVAALLASAATAARLDLWPTSTGPAHGLNESQTYAASEERIGCAPGRHCRTASVDRSRGHPWQRRCGHRRSRANPNPCVVSTLAWACLTLRLSDHRHVPRRRFPLRPEAAHRDVIQRRGGAAAEASRRIGSGRAGSGSGAVAAWALAPNACSMHASMQASLLWVPSTVSVLVRHAGPLCGACWAAGLQRSWVTT